VANGDYATELDSLDAAHARSPMANGNNEIVRDAAGRRRHLIIDADGTGGLGNRESNDRRPAEQDC
jgi:hypothetical protein